MSETDMDDADKPMLVYATFPDADEAAKIGEQLVAARLSACVNILPSMVSIYRWQGKIEKGNEAVMLVKTRTSLVAAVMTAIARQHPYDVPAMLALAIDSGWPPYIDWLLENSSAAPGRKTG